MYKVMKIYYDKVTGVKLWDVSYNQPAVVDFERDYATVIDLKMRVKESIGLLVLENGQYAQEFAESNGYRVNPVTKTLEFSYPDPNEPEVPQPFVKPLSVVVDDVIRENKFLKAQIQANADRADFQEEVITEIILTIMP